MHRGGPLRCETRQEESVTQRMGDGSETTTTRTTTVIIDSSPGESSTPGTKEPSVAELIAHFRRMQPARALRLRELAAIDSSVEGAVEQIAARLAGVKARAAAPRAASMQRVALAHEIDEQRRALRCAASAVELAERVVAATRAAVTAADVPRAAALAARTASANDAKRTAQSDTAVIAKRVGIASETLGRLGAASKLKMKAAALHQEAAALRTAAEAAHAEARKVTVRAAASATALGETSSADVAVVAEGARRLKLLVSRDEAAKALLSAQRAHSAESTAAAASEVAARNANASLAALRVEIATREAELVGKTARASTLRAESSAALDAALALVAQGDETLRRPDTAEAVAALTATLVARAETTASSSGDGSTVLRASTAQLVAGKKTLSTLKGKRTKLKKAAIALKQKEKSRREARRKAEQKAMSEAVTARAAAESHAIDAAKSEELALMAQVEAMAKSAKTAKVAATKSALATKRADKKKATLCENAHRRDCESRLAELTGKSRGKKQTLKSVAQRIERRHTILCKKETDARAGVERATLELADALAEKKERVALAARTAARAESERVETERAARALERDESRERERQAEEDAAEEAAAQAARETKIQKERQGKRNGRKGAAGKPSSASAARSSFAAAAVAFSSRAPISSREAPAVPSRSRKPSRAVPRVETTSAIFRGSAADEDDAIGGNIGDAVFSVAPARAPRAVYGGARRGAIKKKKKKRRAKEHRAAAATSSVLGDDEDDAWAAMLAG